jgi:hypothetical protein
MYHINIFSGLVEVLWNREHFTSLHNAVTLAKCFHSRIWENSSFVTKQLTGIGNLAIYAVAIKYCDLPLVLSTMIR